MFVYKSSGNCCSISKNLYHFDVKDFTRIRLNTISIYLALYFNDVDSLISYFTKNEFYST